MRTLLVVALTCLAAASAAPAQDGPSLHRQVRKIMGTFCEIQVYHPDAQLAGNAIAGALDEMQRVDRLLSNYDQASELSAPCVQVWLSGATSVTPGRTMPSSGEMTWVMP